MRALCVIQPKDRKRSEDLMMDLNKAMYQLAITNSVHWYGHVLKRE